MVSPVNHPADSDLSDPRPPAPPTGPGAHRRMRPWPATWAARWPSSCRQMIRNACVNDGTPESGHEQRNADVLRGRARRARPRHGDLRAPARAHLAGGPDRGPTTRRAPAWPSSGTPTSCPPTATTGATTPSAARSSTARCGAGVRSTCSTSRRRWPWPSRHLADEGFRPEGDLLFIGVADEEALGSHGAQWLTEHHRRRGALPTTSSPRPAASPWPAPTASACPSSPGRRARSGAP